MRIGNRDRAAQQARVLPTPDRRCRGALRRKRDLHVRPHFPTRASGVDSPLQHRNLFDLDAPNSEKLSKILEERSKESQFILVSLKDSVVQKAKLIYGVFPKNGVSNVVTYKDKRMPSVRAS